MPAQSEISPVIPLPPQVPGPVEATVLAEQNFADFSVFKPKMDMLVSDWAELEDRARDGRTLRQSRVDVDQLRSSGKIGANEVYIAVKVIDENITRQLPPRLQYLKASGRLAIFEPIDQNLNADTSTIQQLEAEFWRGMTYDDWELDYTKTFDGAELLGWDWVEIVFDTSKPCHVRVDHVGNDAMLFDRRVANIQDSTLVARRFNISEVQLRKLAAANDFDPTTTQKIIERLREENNKDGANIFHCYYKDHNGMVFQCWYYKDGDTFLAVPKPFYVGVDVEKQSVAPALDGGMEPVVTTTWEHVHEDAYPFIPLYKRNTEAKEIVNIPGRVEDDFYMQESTSSLLSSLVNSSKNAANVMFSPKDPNPERGTSAPKQTEVVIKNGVIWDVPMVAISTPFPEAGLFRTIETLFTRNAEANAQISAATMNRQDSRKTATEVAVANKTNQELSGAETLFFSLFVRNICQATWRIMQSQAEQGLIKFLPLPSGENNIAFIKQKFSIKPAGDTDYVLRANKISSMQQDMTFMVKTPLAEIFMSDYIQLRYPDRFQAYKAVVDAAKTSREAQLKQTLTSVSGLLSHAITDESGKLRPEWAGQKQQLQQLAQQVTSLTNGPAQSPTEPGPQEG